MTTKAQHLAKAKTAQRTLEASEDKMNSAAQVRDAALLGAQEQGATRAEMEQATGLSTTRVTQVLRRARATRN